MTTNPPDDGALPPGAEQRPAGEASATVTQSEIDDVVADQRLSDAERQARLMELRQRLLDASHADGDESFEPLRMQLMDALSMLAEGGHDYGAAGRRVEGEEIAPDEASAPPDRPAPR